MLLQIVLLVLTFLAVALVSGNNLSACVGPAIGSKILSSKTGVLLGAIGFSLGLLSQGSIMANSIRALMPNSTALLQADALSVAVLVFVIAGVIRVPVPLSMSLVGLFAGLSLSRNVLAGRPLLVETVILWFIAPGIAIALVFYLVRIINRSHPRNIWLRVQSFRILLVVLAFSTSFVLGANTIGLIVCTVGFNLSTVVVAVVAIFVGCFLLSRGEIRRVSRELFLLRYPNAAVTLLTSTVLVEVATIFNIPLSNTQIISAALFGTGISYKNKLISVKPFLIIVSGWIIAPLLSFAIGLIL